MRPDRETNNAFLYCLAVAADRTGVSVLFFVAMSNHYHAGVLDTEGRLPEFLEHFHKLFAKHQNALRGRWENFWAPEQTSAVHLLDDGDVIDKMIYALTNPVKDHLVATAASWPGATSLHAQLDGARIRVVRPSHFFDRQGAMPERLELAISRPGSLASMPTHDYRQLLRERIREAEERAAMERRRKRIPIVGAQAVVRQHWSHGPSTPAPRWRLSPRVACKDRWRRLEALARNKTFLAAYRVARERVLAGLCAVFPAGTYWLRRFAGLVCEDPLTAVA